MIYPVEGNQKRVEWVETMLELCMDVSIRNILASVSHEHLCRNSDAIEIIRTSNLRSSLRSN